MVKKAIINLVDATKAMDKVIEEAKKTAKELKEQREAEAAARKSSTPQ